MGVSLAFMFEGLTGKFGTILINEGMEDASFALSSLEKGYFTWNDYMDHKKDNLKKEVIQYIFKISVDSENVVTNKITEIGKCLGGPYIHKTGYDILVQEGFKGAKKIMKETAIKTIIKCKKACMESSVSLGTDFLIKQYLNDATIKFVENVSDLIQQDFYKHEIHKTITKLLTFYNRNVLRKIIEEDYQKTCLNFEKTKEDFSGCIKTIDLLIPPDNKFKEIFSTVSECAETTSDIIFVRRILTMLNKSLKNKLKLRYFMTINLDNNEKNEFIDEIVEYLKIEAAKHCRYVFNSNVVKPAIKYVGNMMTKNAVKGIEFIVRESISQYKENKLKQRAMKLHKAMKNYNTVCNPDQIHIPDDLVKEAMYIRSRTRNIERYTQMMKLNIPYDPIGIKCVQEALELKFGCEFQLIVHKNGNEYVFGECRNKNVKTINLELVNEHFLNSEDARNGNDCLYYAICKDFPDLRNKMTPVDLRNAAAAVVNKNDRIKQDIKNYDKKFYMEISFHGGDMQKNPNRSTFSTDHAGWKGEYEADFIPVKSNLNTVKK